MDRRQLKEIFKITRRDFLKFLDVDDVITRMVQMNVLEERDYEKIKATGGRKRQVQVLLGIIERTDPEYEPLPKFIECLIYCKRPTLVKKIKRAIVICCPCSRPPSNKIEVHKKYLHFSTKSVLFVLEVEKDAPLVRIRRNGQTDDDMVLIEKLGEIRSWMQKNPPKNDLDREVLLKAFEDVTKMAEKETIVNCNYLKMKINILKGWLFHVVEEKENAKTCFDAALELSDGLSPSHDTAGCLYDYVNYYQIAEGKSFEPKAKELLRIAHAHAQAAKDANLLYPFYERTQYLNSAGLVLEFVPSDVYSGKILQNQDVYTREYKEENINAAQHLLNPNKDIWRNPDECESKTRLSFHVHWAVICVQMKNFKQAKDWLENAENLYENLPDGFAYLKNNLKNWKNVLGDLVVEIRE